VTLGAHQPSGPDLLGQLRIGQCRLQHGADVALQPGIDPLPGVAAEPGRPPGQTADQPGPLRRDTAQLRTVQGALGLGQRTGQLQQTRHLVRDGGDQQVRQPGRPRRALEPRDLLRGGALPGGPGLRDQLVADGDEVLGRDPVEPLRGVADVHDRLSSGSRAYPPAPRGRGCGRTG
jgi:hypothetical protein